MKTKALIGMAVMGVAPWLVGCDATSSAPSEATTGAATAAVGEHDIGMMGGKCPMQVPGTTVTSADVEGGVALAFTTRAGDVADLRQRVRGMVEMHNRHYAAGGMMMGQGYGRRGASAEYDESQAGAASDRGAADGGGMMMGGGTMMPAATASVEDIEGGARLVFRPKDPAELEALREHARMREGRMARGECPMISPRAEGQAMPPTSFGDADRGARHPPHSVVR